VLRVIRDIDKIDTLHIAGNGIYSLCEKFTQGMLDDFIFDFIERVNMFCHINSIVTGGQSGSDESGAKAGSRLGILTTINAPYRWMFRNISGVDICNEQLFKERFKIISNV